MSKIGIVAGSFDPITNGHVWLIKKAGEMLGPDGILHIAMGVNPVKKYYFSEEHRRVQICNVLDEECRKDQGFPLIVVTAIRNDLLVNYAKNVGGSYIFRGIRNTEDFNYEAQIQQVNRKICNDIETVFFIPPPEFSEISSSTVKGIVGFNGWEPIIEQYVHLSIVEDFRKKLL